jgi:hypothetical protein
MFTKPTRRCEATLKVGEERNITTAKEEMFTKATRRGEATLKVGEERNITTAKEEMFTKATWRGEATLKVGEERNIITAKEKMFTKTGKVFHSASGEPVAVARNLNMLTALWTIFLKISLAGEICPEAGGPNTNMLTALRTMFTKISLAGEIFPTAVVGRNMSMFPVAWTMFLKISLAEETRPLVLGPNQNMLMAAPTGEAKTKDGDEPERTGEENIYLAAAPTGKAKNKDGKEAENEREENKMAMALIMDTLVLSESARTGAAVANPVIGYIDFKGNYVDLSCEADHFVVRNRAVVRDKYMEEGKMMSTVVRDMDETGELVVANGKQGFDMVFHGTGGNGQDWNKFNQPLEEIKQAIAAIYEFSRASAGLRTVIENNDEIKGGLEAVRLHHKGGVSSGPHREACESEIWCVGLEAG